MNINFHFFHLKVKKKKNTQKQLEEKIICLWNRWWSLIFGPEVHYSSPHPPSLKPLEGYREEGLQREKEKAAYGQHQYQTKSDQKMDHWLRFPSLVAIETALLGSDPPSLWAHQSWDWLWLCCRSRPCSRTWPCKKSPDRPRGGPSGQDCRTWRCWGRGRRGGLGFGGGCGEMRWLWKEEEGGGGERVWRRRVNYI